MNKSFSVLFYAKRAKKTARGTTPICMRVTVDGLRFEISTRRSVDLANWNATAQKLLATTNEAKEINQYFKSMEHGYMSNTAKCWTGK